MNTFVNIKKLSSIFVVDPYGAKVLISSFWQANPAIVVFLRSFACSACRGAASDVWAQRDKLGANGTKIIFVGNGSPEAIQDFKDELKIQSAPVYTDPTLESFKACGFKMSAMNYYSGDGKINIDKYVAKGFPEKQVKGAFAGDGLQLGGIVAIRPVDQVTYHYISQVAGDYPEKIT